MSSKNIPTYDRLIFPMLEALKRLGGSASVNEIDDEMIRSLDLSEEALSFRREGSSSNELNYRARWARNYLKQYGAIERTARGVWTLTPKGRSVTLEEAKRIPSVVKKNYRDPISTTDVAAAAKSHSEDPVLSSDTDEDWKARLLEVVKELTPAAFERLAQRVLRESGFVKVEVTGRSGDGGIDGIGVLRIRLVSFQVLFQCKKYAETVGPSAIRDFRGAMVGRTDKGLVITTGRFTADARKEATRDGAPPIELIDGETLCDLLKELSIGVSVEKVEIVKIHPDALKAI